MSLLGAIVRVLKGIGVAVLKALRFAEANGLTDDLIDLALSLVMRAEVQFPDTDTRREWVVGQLTSRRVPESIARLAVELAVQAYKNEIAGR